MRPLQGITRATIVLTIVVLFTSVLNYVITAIRGPAQFTGDESLGASAAYSGIGVLLALVAIAQIVVGAVWCYKAQQQALARGAKWDAGWAAGGWFIPLANMVLPFLVLRDMAAALLRRVPSYFVPWWVLWIVYNLGAVAGAIYGGVQGFQLGVALVEGQDVTAQATELAQTNMIVGAISLVVYIVAGLLWLRFLRDIGAVEADASAVM